MNFCLYSIATVTIIHYIGPLYNPYDVSALHRKCLKGIIILVMVCILLILIREETTESSVSLVISDKETKKQHLNHRLRYKRFTECVQVRKCVD